MGRLSSIFWKWLSMKYPLWKIMLVDGLGFSILYWVVYIARL